MGDNDLVLYLRKWIDYQDNDTSAHLLQLDGIEECLDKDDRQELNKNETRRLHRQAGHRAILGFVP